MRAQDRKTALCSSITKPKKKLMINRHPCCMAIKMHLRYKAEQIRMLALLAYDFADIDAFLNDLREKQDSAESAEDARARNNLGDLGELPTEAIAMIFDHCSSPADVRLICNAARNVSDTSRTRLVVGHGAEHPITAKPDIVLRSKRLKELHVQHFVINKGELLLAAATRCSAHLRKLVLSSSSHDLDVLGASAIAQALEQLTGLQELDLDGFITTSAAVIAAVARLTRLRSLRVNVDRDGAVALARSLPQLLELEDLEVRFNGIGDAGASVLGPALAQLRSLRKLILCDGRSSEKIGPDGGAAIGEALRDLTGLRDLDVSGFDYDSFFATFLMPAMMAATGLISLSISCRFERDLSKSMINAAFRGMVVLEELIVTGVDISLLPLASMVNLRILCLSRGEASLDAAAMASALSKLTHLEQLGLWDWRTEEIADFRALFVAAKGCLLVM